MTFPGPTVGQARIIEATPFEPFDPLTLPPREWLYGKHYQGGIALPRPWGPAAESSLDLVEMIALCTGRNLLGEQPLERQFKICRNLS